MRPAFTPSLACLVIVPIAQCAFLTSVLAPVRVWFFSVGGLHFSVEAAVEVEVFAVAAAAAPAAPVVALLARPFSSVARLEPDEETITGAAGAAAAPPFPPPPLGGVGLPPVPPPFPDPGLPGAPALTPTSHVLACELRTVMVTFPLISTTREARQGSGDAAPDWGSSHG